MLSFYFLLIARFGMKNARIEKSFEPLMHVVCLGYPLVTAIVGAVMGVYSEPDLGLGCWVHDYPSASACDFMGDPHGTDECLSPMIAWIFGGIWFILVFFALVINNMIIWFFVRRQTTRSVNVKTRPSVDIFERDNTYNEDSGKAEAKEDVLSQADESDSRSASQADESGPPSASEESLHTQRAELQIKRLQLVRSQALLFVGSYGICIIWTGVLRLIEGYATSYEETLPANNYILLVLQAWFLPLQGFFNMLVYVRPRYLKRRKTFLKESRFMSLRRVLYGDESGASENGDELKTPGILNPVKDGKENDENRKIKAPVEEEQFCKRLPAGMVSSMTASHGDFECPLESDGRWNGTAQAQSNPLQAVARARSMQLMDISNFSSISESRELYPELDGTRPKLEDDKNMSSISFNVSSSSLPGNSSSFRLKSDRMAPGAIPDSPMHFPRRPHSDIDSPASSRLAGPIKRMPRQDIPMELPTRVESTVEIVE